MYLDGDPIGGWETREDDPDAGGRAHPYRCTRCDWTGRGAESLKHYRATGHAIRGRDWPKTWPDAEFSFQKRG